jgi:hypothetical protein
VECGYSGVPGVAAANAVPRRQDCKRLSEGREFRSWRRHTALDMAFLKTKGIKSFVPISLSNQTTWFNGVLKLLASKPNGNYTMAFFKNKSFTAIVNSILCCACNCNCFGELASGDLESRSSR